MQLGFVGQWIDVQAVQWDSGGITNRGFAAIGVLAARVIVRAIVELDDRRNAEILVAQDEVGGEAVVAIPDGLEVVALLHADDLRKADLGQDDTVRIRTDQALVELLLDRREYLLREDRPVFRLALPCPSSAGRVSSRRRRRRRRGEE